MRQHERNATDQPSEHQHWRQGKAVLLLRGSGLLRGMTRRATDWRRSNGGAVGERWAMRLNPHEGHRAADGAIQAGAEHEERNVG